MSEIPKEFFQALDHGSLEKVQDLLLKNPRLPDMVTDQGHHDRIAGSLQ